MARARTIAKAKAADHSPARINIGIQVEMMPVTRLIPSAQNARTHTREQVANIAASIKEWGWTNPILVGADDDVIAGHARLLAARKLSMTEVPVIVLRHLTPDQRQALLIADNQLAITGAGWDEELLRNELAKLRDEDFNLELLGFNDIELARLLEREALAAGLTDEDLVPGLPQEPVARVGDLFVLGAHRVLCGDSTRAGDVERLMAGEKAWLMATDPPYGVAVGDGGGPESLQRFGGLKNDDKQGADLLTFLSAAFQAAVPHLEPGAAWYIWHASRTQEQFAAAAASVGVEVHSTIVWAKSSFVFGRSDYHWQHEPCFYGWRKGEKHRWFGDRSQGTVWNIDKPAAAESHPTSKPVEIFVRPLLNHTHPGEACYDAFLGSGTTLIAAEQTGRVCYGVELDPKYVDVIVRRWQQYTGHQAILEGDGRPFDEVAAARLGDAVVAPPRAPHA